MEEKGCSRGNSQCKVLSQEYSWCILKWQALIIESSYLSMWFVFTCQTCQAYTLGRIDIDYLFIHSFIHSIDDLCMVIVYFFILLESLLFNCFCVKVSFICILKSWLMIKYFHIFFKICYTYSYGSHFINHLISCCVSFSPFSFV